MPSDKEQFFQLNSYAVVGHSELRPFPRLSYGNLRKMGKEVFPVDLSGAKKVEGDEAFASLSDLPQEVEGIMVEVPKEKTMEVVKEVVKLGVKDLWLHMHTDTPEVLELCEAEGIRVRHGTCGVMYTQQGASFHSIHKWIMKVLKKY